MHPNKRHRTIFPYKQPSSFPPDPFPLPQMFFDGRFLSALLLRPSAANLLPLFRVLLRLIPSVSVILQVDNSMSLTLALIQTLIPAD